MEGDFEENFYNLPYKLQVAFEWAYLYCNASYILKTDDDVFINIKNAFTFLSEINIKDLYTGYVWPHATVQRLGKYKVTHEEFNGTHYPPFVSGSSMFLTPSVIKRLVLIFPKEKVFKLDDVYIGILIHKLGINVTISKAEGKKNYWEVWGEEPKQQCQIYKHAIVRHTHGGNEKLWCMRKLYDTS